MILVSGQVYAIVLYILIFIISVLQPCYCSEWKNIQLAHNASDNDYVIIISADSDIDVKLEKDGRSTIQNNPGLIGANEYIYVDANVNDFQLYYRDVSKNEYETRIVTTAEFIHSQQDKLIYQELSAASQLFYQKTSEGLIAAEKKLKNLVKEYKSHVLFPKILQQYLFVLLENENIQEISKIINDIDVAIHPDLESKLNYLYISSQFHSLTGNYEIAVQDLSQFLLSENPAVKKKSNKINLETIRLNLGLFKSILSRKNTSSDDNGQSELQLSLSNSLKIGNNLLTYQVLMALGSYYTVVDKNTDAIAILDVAEEYLLKSGVNTQQVFLYNQKGLAYRNLNQLNHSQFYFRKAILNTNSSTSLSVMSALYYNLALTYESIGDFGKAKRFYQESKKETHNQFYNALADTSIGKVERKSNNAEKAIELHLKNLDVLSLNSFNIWINTLNELSKDYYIAGKYQDSEVTALVSLLLNKLNYLEQNLTKQDYLSVLNLFELRQDTYKNDIFKYEIVELYKIFKYLYSEYPLINNAREINSILILANHAALNNRNLCNFLTRSMSCTKVSENNSLFIYDLLSRNNPLSKLGLDGHLDYFETYIDLEFKTAKEKALNKTLPMAMDYINSIRSQFDLSDLALYWTHQAKTITNKYINALIEQQSYEAVFRILEKYYAINLRERRSGTVDESIRLKSGEIQQALENYMSLERQSIISGAANTQTQADEAKELYLALSQSEKKTEPKTELQHLSIQQVQSELAESELYLRYYLNKDSGICFVIDKNSYEVMKLPDLQKLQQWVEQYLSQIHSLSFSGFIKPSGFYHSILPANKLESGRFNKLIITTDGILNLMPFDTININNQEGQYQPLAEIVEIERTFSASDYFADIKNQVLNPKSVSIFANPVFVQDAASIIQSQINKDNKLWSFYPLPFTLNESQYIQQALAGFKFNLLSGKNATNENFMSEQNRNANIIHIATHGFFNDKSLENAGLATSVIDNKNQQAPGILTMREILYQRFQSNLAVVSGCETTRGKHINGEGFNSLSRGLLSQGVNSVIGTIWPVSDRPSAVFMKEFYNNLRTYNGNVSKALNQSQRNFIQLPQYRRYRHPYYWAGYVLTSANRHISANIFCDGKGIECSIFDGLKE